MTLITNDPALLLERERDGTLECASCHEAADDDGIEVEYGWYREHQALLDHVEKHWP